jgi:putative SOS response-associated peptidase YedK
MCGRYTLGVPPVRIAEIFELLETPELAPRYNIAPTQQAPVILASGGRRTLELRRWGLVPFWAKDPAIGNRLINARSESVEEKPSFRTAFRKHRCLVPADGFYEWKPAGRRKQPYWIHRRDGQPFAMAGLYERWHADREDEIRSFTVLTTEANPLVRPIHARMPVILDAAAWSEWLDPGAPVGALRALLRPAPAADFDTRPVSTLVNAPAVDDFRCIEAVNEATA